MGFGFAFSNFLQSIYYNIIIKQYFLLGVLLYVRGKIHSSVACVISVYSPILNRNRQRRSRKKK